MLAWLAHCHANILSSTGHESNIAQTKADNRPSPTSHFVPFNCCLSVVLQLDKGDYLKNPHVVFCPDK